MPTARHRALDRDLRRAGVEAGIGSQRDRTGVGLRAGADHVGGQRAGAPSSREGVDVADVAADPDCIGCSTFVLFSMQVVAAGIDDALQNDAGWRRRRECWPG